MSNSVESKWSKLIVSLYESTQNEKILWSNPAGNSFVTVAGGVVIELEKSNSLANPSLLYIIRIIKDGNVIEAFNDEEISDTVFREAVDDVYSGDSAYRIMNMLMELIERRMSGADEILDDVLNFLAEK